LLLVVWKARFRDLMVSNASRSLGTTRQTACDSNCTIGLCCSFTFIVLGVYWLYNLPAPISQSVSPVHNQDLQAGSARRPAAFVGCPGTTRPALLSRTPLQITRRPRIRSRQRCRPQGSPFLFAVLDRARLPSDSRCAEWPHGASHSTWTTTGPRSAASFPRVSPTAARRHRPAPPRAAGASSSGGRPRPFSAHCHHGAPPAASSSKRVCDGELDLAVRTHTHTAKFKQKKREWGTDCSSSWTEILWFS
jgi:hypothetical protein